MFPLELLGQYPYVTQILEYLPFQYLAYFPAMVFLEKKQGVELLVDIGVEASWAIALLLLSRMMYRWGLKHYCAFGG
jgi:ABC-2 type transport system permease protein